MSIEREKVVKGNESIAKFLGAYWVNDDLEAFPYGYWMIDDDDIDLPLNSSDFEFHSWNWLMPVIDKIEHLFETKQILPRFEINSHHCAFNHNGFDGIVGCYIGSPEDIACETKLEAAWTLCVEFVNWYNNRYGK